MSPDASCPAHTPLKSLKALQDQVEQLLAMVEWQATRIEFLDGRVRQLESRPRPWRLLFESPIFDTPNTGTPLPPPIEVTCSPAPGCEVVSGPAAWPGMLETAAGEKWGGTD